MNALSMIEQLYNAPASSLNVPEGYILTDDFREPQVGEIYLSVPSREPLQRKNVSKLVNTTVAGKRRLIVEKT